MNIGEAAAASGVSAKMIRHYESIGLIPRPPRSFSGYRRYDDSDVQRLRFIRRARDAGFDTGRIRELVGLWQDRRRPSRDVKRLAHAHVAEIHARIEELQRIAGALAHLVAHCHGDERPDCPILDSLVDDDGAMTEAPPAARPSRPRPSPRAPRRR